MLPLKCSGESWSTRQRNLSGDNSGETYMCTVTVSSHRSNYDQIIIRRLSSSQGQCMRSIPIHIILGILYFKYEDMQKHIQLSKLISNLDIYFGKKMAERENLEEFKKYFMTGTVTNSVHQKLKFFRGKVLNWWEYGNRKISDAVYCFLVCYFTS